MEEDRCDGRRKGMGYGAVDRLAVAPRVKGGRGETGWVVASWYAL